MIIESLDRIGFPGQIYPVNPKYETLFGRPCYPSIADLPEAVDLLAVCVNHARVLEHMRPAARRGVRAAIIFDAFTESDSVVGRLDDDLLPTAAAGGFRGAVPRVRGNSPRPMSWMTST